MKKTALPILHVGIEENDFSHIGVVIYVGEITKEVDDDEIRELQKLKRLVRDLLEKEGYTTNDFNT